MTSKHNRDEAVDEVAERPRKKSKHRTGDRDGSRRKTDKSANNVQGEDVELDIGKGQDVEDSKEKREKKKREKKDMKDVSDKSIKNDPDKQAQPDREEKQEKARKEQKNKKDKKDKKDKKTQKQAAEPQHKAKPQEDDVEENEIEEMQHNALDADKSQQNAVGSKSTPESAKPINDKASLATTGSTGYTETNALKAVPESEILAFLTKHNVNVTNQASFPCFRPIMSFSYLPDSVLTNKSPFAAFKTPTPIQAASWPYALAGRDIVGVAETGSGKTMAFALPCVQAINTNVTGGKGNRNITRAVVVSPTRELAMQTHEQMERLCELVGLKCVCVYGGAPKGDQANLLRRGATVVVATPGRLKDFLSDGTVKLDSASFVVLDEADRMLDTGFENDVREILSACPDTSRRQTLMFTATWPQSVQKLAATFMKTPVKITIGRGPSAANETASSSSTGEVKLQANERIKQEVEVIDQRAKEQRALSIIKKYQAGAKKNDRILVFCLYKKEAVRVESFLARNGVRVCSIHGDLNQARRTQSLEEFKTGRTPVLVATDVAARGLDVPEVKLVLNMTFPLTIEDYVHRIGRTGRAGKTGHAITFFTDHDKSKSGELINILKTAGQSVPEELLAFGTTVKKKGHDVYGAFYKDVDVNAKAKKIIFD